MEVMQFNKDMLKLRLKAWVDQFPENTIFDITDFGTEIDISAMVK